MTLWSDIASIGACTVEFLQLSKVTSKVDYKNHNLIPRSGFFTALIYCRLFCSTTGPRSCDIHVYAYLIALVTNILREFRLENWFLLAYPYLIPMVDEHGQTREDYMVDLTY